MTSTEAVVMMAVRTGIVYVVDSCFVKMKGYNPKTGIESLVVRPPLS